MYIHSACCWITLENWGVLSGGGAPRNAALLTPPKYKKKRVPPPWLMVTLHFPLLLFSTALWCHQSFQKINLPQGRNISTSCQMKEFNGPCRYYYYRPAWSSASGGIDGTKIMLNKFNIWRAPLHRQLTIINDVLHNVSVPQAKHERFLPQRAVIGIRCNYYKMDTGRRIPWERCGDCISKKYNHLTVGQSTWWKVYYMYVVLHCTHGSVSSSNALDISTHRAYNRTEWTLGLHLAS